MLQASIQQLNTQLIHKAVDLRKKELDFYSNWILFMVFCATIVFVNGLNGFVFPTQLAPLDQQTIAYDIAHVVYVVSSALAASLEFAVITCALYAMLLGPGLALRGPAGSMDKAVEGLKTIVGSMFNMFIAGLAFAQLALLMYFCVSLFVPEWELALFLNILVLGANLIFVRKTVVVYRYFWYQKQVGAAGLSAAAQAFARAANNPQSQPVSAQPVASAPMPTSNSSMPISNSFTASAPPHTSTAVDMESDAAIGGSARAVKKKKKGWF